MAEDTAVLERRIPGSPGTLALRVWRAPNPTWAALLVHSHSDHAGRYEWLARRLVDTRATVFAPDHAGHGLSSGEPALISDAEAVVADLELVRQEISAAHPQLPVVVIGHSVGGMLAARYAQRHEQRLVALVLASPVLGTWHMLELLEHEVIPQVSIRPTTLSRDEAAGAQYLQDPLVWHGPFKRATLDAISRCLTAIDDGPVLGCPALWIHGEEDEIVPAEDTRGGINRIRGASFYEHIYPAARHELFQETNRGDVVEDVLTFISRQLGS